MRICLLFTVGRGDVSGFSGFSGFSGLSATWSVSFFGVGTGVGCGVGVGLALTGTAHVLAPSSPSLQRRWMSPDYKKNKHTIEQV